MTDYRKEAELALDELKVKRANLVERVSILDHAINMNLRIIELTGKLRDE